MHWRLASVSEVMRSFICGTRSLILLSKLAPMLRIIC